MRRKSLQKRERNGKPQRAREQQKPSPTEVKRLQAAALMGLRDSVWGSTLGLMFLNGKLTHGEFDAGARWSELMHDFRMTLGGPQHARTVNMQRTGQSFNVKDSEERDTRVRAEYEAALRALTDAGTYKRGREALLHTCELGLFPVGQRQLDDLTGALRVLEKFWHFGGSRR